ncbi:phosphatase PAP2 family protein [Adhaeribacter soli]|uniref:Phosphatase PAP2 family protein n=1 Tax=Adhaeribacter soli TaxID=2607655 RepID=A0A5N1IMB3_9BACT|nr:phosphatase PAP2 family protein [Adhaeribacter soli]KAA9327295.1 phosphatase PAP2 family protein [Adhaeribacter soli]
MRKVIERAWIRLAAMFALFTVELIVVLALFLTCIIVFLLLGREILGGREVYFDQAAFHYMDTIATPFLTSVAVFFSFLGSAPFITGAAIILIVYFLFIKKHRWYSLKVPVIAVGSITLNLVTKYFFNRQRPIIPHLVEASGLSFPSGHSMVSASFYGLLIYLSWHNIQDRRLHHLFTFILIATIFLIGCSRVYLHVHYATDVMAGFAAGFLWVILGIYGLRRMERYSRRNLDPIVQEAVVKTE